MYLQHFCATYGYRAAAVHKIGDSNPRHTPPGWSKVKVDGTTRKSVYEFLTLLANRHQHQSSRTLLHLSLFSEACLIHSGTVIVYLRKNKVELLCKIFNSFDIVICVFKNMSNSISEHKSTLLVTTEQEEILRGIYVHYGWGYCLCLRVTLVKLKCYNRAQTGQVYTIQPPNKTRLIVSHYELDRTVFTSCNARPGSKCAWSRQWSSASVDDTAACSQETIPACTPKLNYVGLWSISVRGLMELTRMIAAHFHCQHPHCYPTIQITARWVYDNDANKLRLFNHGL